jgi:hypothetical protein
MKDPWIDNGRRAWLPCPWCVTAEPLWLLGSEVNWIFVQCPACMSRSWVDTHCGVGHRPAGLTFPQLEDGEL